MSKTLNEGKIAGRAERKRLAAGVHWRGIDREVHLGYRKGKRGGSWLVRWYVGSSAYRQRTLGTADDELSIGTLDYSSAVKLARETVETERRKARASAEGPALTVETAIHTYAASRDARDSRQKGREARSDASSRLTRYVTGRDASGGRKNIAASSLAEVALHELTESALLEWRRALPSTLKGATQQRLVNDFKAALNGAYMENRSRLPDSLPAIIKHGLAVGRACDNEPDVPFARDNQILSDTNVSRVIRAAKEIDAEQGWEGDLFRLVMLLAATGARFSQVVRLRVGDVQAEAGRIMMPMSRKGRGRKMESGPVPVGPDIMAALLPCVAERKTDDVLLERWRNKQVAGTIRWERVARGSWQSASELIRPWAKIRARTELPNLIPYALRHSSIVRGIRANLPIRLVAALHDTSVVMIERHYGRHIADGLDELAARSVVPLL